MSLTDPERDELFASLRRDVRHFAPELAKLSFERGLAVTNKDDGTTRPIPITATPVVVDEAELEHRVTLSSMLSTAGFKMSRAVLAGDRRDVVIGALSPLEAELTLATWEHLETLPNTRVDYFVGRTAGGEPKPRALEINATIPAMQAYSDIAANTFLEVVGRFWHAPDHVIAGWQAKNGSNSLALYRALLSGYQRFRPGQAPARIALLSRRNDAQLTEQRALCERFREWGSEADVVHPDQLSGDDAVRANGKTYDLVYRHLFLRRLEEPGMEGADYVKALLAEKNGTRAVVLNPPATQVEVKAVFALLSQALDDRALAREARLTGAELQAIKESVPWTRELRGPDLVARVAADPDRYVLKRSWDYGGRTVFVGRTRETPAFQERVQAAYGQPLEWNALCARAVEDTAGGGFVVQELVETKPEPHVLCGASGPSEVELYVDFSAYASVGIAGAKLPHWGGVCRGSLSPVVNIVGGGGVLPLLTTEVARSLLMAFRAWNR